MADNNVLSAQNTEYSKILNNIIKKNQELTNSLKITRKEIDAQNKSFENTTKTMKAYLTTMQQINRNMTGRNINPTNSTNTTTLMNSFVNASQTQQNTRTNVLNTGTPLNTKSGQTNLLGLAQNSIQGYKLGSRIANQGIGSITDPNTLKSISSLTSSAGSASRAVSSLGTATSGTSQAVAGLSSASGGASSALAGVGTAGIAAGAAVAGAAIIIGALVVILTKMTKMGESAYKTQLNMAQSLKKLGDGSKYATTYAKQLNEELGVSMSKTLASLSNFSQQLQAQGFSSDYAGKFAVNVSKMADIYSKKMGTSYTETQKLFEEAISGSDAALTSLFSTSSSAFAGWLMDVKGINMAMVQLSPGRLSQEYSEFLTYLTANMNGVGEGATSTARRIEEIMNKLSDIGEKLKVMFLPLFEFIINGVSKVVDFIFDAVNGIRKLFGAKPLVLDIEATPMFDKGMEKQLNDWTKLGERIDATKGKLYSFDEVESQTGLLQAEEDTDNTSQNFEETLGLDSSKFDIPIEVDVSVEDMELEEFKKHVEGMSNLEIALEASNTEQLNYAYDLLTDAQKRGKEGVVIAFKSLLQGDGWGFLRGLTDLIGGAKIKTMELQKEVSVGLVGGFFDVLIACSDWLDDYIPGLKEVTEWLKDIKQKALEIFNKAWDFSINIVTKLVDTVSGWFDSKSKQKAVKDKYSSSQLALFDKINSGSSNNKIISTSNNSSKTNGSGYGFKAEAVKIPRLEVFDNGGIAIGPRVAQLGTNQGEMTIPMGSAAAETFYNAMAKSITDKLPNQQQAIASQDTYNINLGKDGVFFGNRTQFMELTEMIADNLQQLQKQRGNLNYGVI